MQHFLKHQFVFLDRQDDGALPMFMKAADVRYCRDAFERFDKDNSGTIDTKVRN